MPMSDELMNEEVMEEVDETTPVEEAEPEDFTEANQAFLERFEFQYDGESKKFETMEQLTEAAQLGSVVPRLRNKLESYENNPLLNYMQSYMKKQGYTDQQQFVTDLQVREKADELVSKGMSEEDAMAEAKSYVKSTSHVNAQTKEIEDFLEWHQQKMQDGIFNKEINENNIPKEVMDDYRLGKSLKDAYSDYMFKSIKQSTEQETISKLAKNKETSSGELKKVKQTNNKEMTVAQINDTLSGMTEAQQEKWLDGNWSMVEKSGYFK